MQMNSNLDGFIPVPAEKAESQHGRHEPDAAAPYEFAAVLDDGEIIEENDRYDLNRFQVVRREFFSHINEPSISFSDYKVGVNSACLKKLPGVEYIQFLIDEKQKKLALRPCLESDPHSFSWCYLSNEKKKPRQVTGKFFFLKLCNLMDWNPNYRYKILGKLIRSNCEYILMFDLSATETYQRVLKEGEKPKMSRTPILPEEWKDQFGLPFEEHRKAMQINIFEDYALYSIKGKDATPQPVTDTRRLPQVTVVDRFPHGGE